MRLWPYMWPYMDFRWILAWKRKEISRKLFCFEGGPAGGVQNMRTGKFNFRSQKSVKRIELVNIDEYNWVNLVAKFLPLKTMFYFPLQYDTNTTFGPSLSLPVVWRSIVVVSRFARFASERHVRAWFMVDRMLESLAKKQYLREWRIIWTSTMENMTTSHLK